RVTKKPSPHGVVAFCRRGFEQFNATVQWTVAGRRPAGGHTNLFLKEKGKRPPAGHQKAITPLGWWLFLLWGIQTIHLFCSVSTGVSWYIIHIV
ncbi:MAG: hypothetical protein IJB11_07060, partial [Oscillospiraceae bacterium]|nr:hypothetical protein [Oscillospiraceae bacterium]